MLNQGRPLLRVERSGARKGKGSRLETSARPGGAEGSGKVQGRGFRVWVHLFDGKCTGPGGGSFATASERSEHRWVWVGGERSSLGGAKDHERRKF